MDSRTIHAGSRIKLLSLLLALIGACGSSAEIKDEKLVKLPAEDRLALADEAHAVEVAEGNVEAARVAVEEAKQFRSIVGNEQKAAAQQEKAVDKAAQLAKQAPDQPGVELAQERQREAAENRQVLKAKDEYGRRLIMWREAEFDLRKVEHERAKLQLERAQYEALKARGIATDSNRKEFEDAERKAERDYAEQQQKVTQAEGYAEAARVMWSDAFESAESTRPDV